MVDMRKTDLSFSKYRKGKTEDEEQRFHGMII